MLWPPLTLEKVGSVQRMLNRRTPEQPYLSRPLGPTSQARQGQGKATRSSLYATGTEVTWTYLVSRTL